MRAVIVTSVTPKCESRTCRNDSARNEAATVPTVRSKILRPSMYTHHKVSAPMIAESPRLK